MLANCLAPITKCAYKKEQQQIKEEAFQDGDFTQKAHQYLASPDVLENTTKTCASGRFTIEHNKAVLSLPLSLSLISVTLTL